MHRCTPFPPRLRYTAPTRRSKSALLVRGKIMTALGDSKKAEEASQAAESISDPVKELAMVDNKSIAQQFREIQQACRQKVRCPRARSMQNTTGPILLRRVYSWRLPAPVRAPWPLAYAPLRRRVTCPPACPEGRLCRSPRVVVRTSASLTLTSTSAQRTVTR